MRLLLQLFKKILANISQKCIILKPKEQKIIRVEALFLDELSGLGIVKILDKTTHSTIRIKLKFMGNSTTHDISNNGLDTIIYNLEEVLGVIDVGSGQERDTANETRRETSTVRP